MKRSKIENMVEYGGRRIRNIASSSRSGERKRSRIGNINPHCYLSLSWVNLKRAHDEFLNLLSQKYREKKNALETFYQRFGICNMTAKTYCIDNVRFLWKCHVDHCPHEFWWMSPYFRCSLHRPLGSRRHLCLASGNPRQAPPAENAFVIIFERRSKQLELCLNHLYWSIHAGIIFTFLHVRMWYRCMYR